MAERQDYRSDPVPVSNKTAAIGAVEWLGDRYLLARPIKAAPGRVALGTLGLSSMLRQLPPRRPNSQVPGQPR
jgi:hypothetical protein